MPNQNLEKSLERVKELRLSGRYPQAFSQALTLAVSAKRLRHPPVELGALWEAMDAGKTVCPQKREFLMDLGRRALSLAKGSPDALVFKEAQIRCAALLRALGDNAGAVRTLKRALAGLERADPQLAGYAFWNLGFALRMEAKIEEGRRAFERALSIFKKTRDSSGAAFSLCGLAGATRLSGDPTLSLRYYRRAKAMFDREGDLYGKAYTRCGMGNALRRMKRWSEAVPLYNEAQRLYQRMKDGVNEGYVLWGRSVCLKNLGRRHEAVSDVRKAGALFRRFHDERGMALLQVWHGQNSKAGAKAVREASLS